MLDSLLAWIIATFLLGPAQAAIAERLEAARAPAEIAAQVSACLQAETPRILARAGQEPMWAIGTGLRVWIGQTAPEDALRDAAPGCIPALDAIRPAAGS